MSFTLYTLRAMLRRFVLFSMALSLCLTTIACGSNSSYGEPSNNQSNNRSQTESVANRAADLSRVPQGKYPVQQATYDDVDGTYRLLLLNTPAGVPSMVETTNLPLARLTDEQIKSGQKSYLNVASDQTALYLSEDFKIEYVHNVVENQPNPATGQPETVVVRQESSFWTPFAGALAGQALGSLLFRPQYYVPPIYQPGIPMAGFGGYGSSYNQAVSRYQSRYQAPPIAVRNRQTFRTTGGLRAGQTRVSNPRRLNTRDRSTGSGYGSSNLRRSNRSGSGYSRPSSRGFGSSRMRAGRRR